jgi:hypothetical protein
MKHIRGLNYNWTKQDIINEKLVVLKDIPTFMGCIETEDFENDYFSDLEFGICKKTGTIQSLNRLSYDYVYIRPHNYCLGKTWNDHHDALANYIIQNVKEDFVVWEIGGGDGSIAKRCIDHVKEWNIIEPNKPDYVFEHDKLTYHSGYYPNIEIRGADLVIHSQLFEHLRDPIDFLTNINCDNQIFSLPNFDCGMKAGYPSMINFEHEQALTHDVMNNLLDSCGYIYERENYNNFAMFYKIKRNHDVKDLVSVDFETSENLITAWHKSLKYQALGLQKILTDKNETENVYFFSAHIFYTMLRSMGLTYNFTGLIDNSPLKIGKRLYGTNLHVYSPEVLRGLKSGIVVIPKVAYLPEMSRQIMEINPNINVISVA